MRLRGLFCAAAVALVAIVAGSHPSALGRPGITPIPCPHQAWEFGDAKFDALDGAKDDLDELVGRAWKKYDEHLARARSLDFDDLLLRTVKLLRDKTDELLAVLKSQGAVAADH